jgi:uncharacterized protein YbjT (DUF2867 family)
LRLQNHSLFRSAEDENRYNPFLADERIVGMKVLLTGANGYIGLRLLPELLAAGHDVFAAVRDPRRLPVAEFEKIPGRIQTIESDLLESPPSFPKDVDVAYYLVHSMGSGGDFAKREGKVARNFAAAIEHTDAGRSYSSVGRCRKGTASHRICNLNSE